MFRFCTMCLILSCCLPAASQSTDVSVLIQRSGADACSVQPDPAAAAITGVTERIVATADAATFMVTAVTLERCNSGSFSAPSTIDGGYPVGNNNGVGGADVVEIGVAELLLSDGRSGPFEVDFATDDGTAVDVAQGGSGVIQLSTNATAVPIPQWTMVLLAVMLGLIAVWALKRQRGLVGLVLAVMAFAVWAANFVLDGQVGDWAGEPMQSDPQGDTTAASQRADIVATFTAAEGGRLFFRVDLVDLDQSAPVAVDDAANTDEDTSVTTVDVRANDSDPDADPLTVQSFDASMSQGVVTDNGDGTFDYDPDGQFESLGVGQSATDSFTYTVNDGQGNSDTATVEITIAGVNDAPNAVDDAVTTNEDTSVSGNVLSNDTDVDSGDTLTATLETGPGNGSASVNADGSFTYTPNSDFEGSDSFTYLASDGTESSTATVTITVSGAGDAPVAVADAYTTDEDTVLNVTAANGVLANDDDADDDPLTAVLDTTTSDGTLVLASDGSFDYTPNADFNGTDSFTYHANDGNADSATVTVTITVGAVDDPPVAVADAYSTDEDTALRVTAANGVLANDNDPENGALTAVLDTTTSDGALVLASDGSFNYTPNSNFNGVDSFTYHANDGSADSATVTVTITVGAVDDPPVAVADAYSTDEDTALSVMAGNGVLANDNDPESGALTAVLDTTTSSGTLALASDGSFNYTPNSNFNGTDSFTYHANDGNSDSATVTVTITVGAVDDPPVAIADAYSTDEDTGLNVTAANGVLANDTDPENGALTAVLDMTTSSGTLALASDGSFVYTPDTDFNGTDSFTYHANDGNSDSATVTVTIDVNPVDDAPTAANDMYATDEDTTLVIMAPGVLINDSDPDAGDTLTAVLDTDVSDGTLTLNADGSFSYTPDLDFDGADSFTYHANDGTTDSNVVTVTITVGAVNDGPMAVDDMEATNEDTVLIIAAPGVLLNDTDPEGDALTVTAFDNLSAVGATVMVNGDGSFTYDPTGSTLLQSLPAGTTIGDFFSYTIEDTGGLQDTATVTVAVTGADDPPTAVDDTATVNEDSGASVIDVLANDTDPDGGSATISAVTQPANGTAVITGGGSGVTYQPDGNYCNDGVTTDDFTYTLMPGGSVATVAVTVACINDLPAADNETFDAVCNVESVVEAAPGQTAAPSGVVFRWVLDNVLIGDSDPVEGSAISIVQASGAPRGTTDATGPDFSITTNEGGSLTLHADGSFVYTPEGGDRGLADSFTYTIQDADGGQATGNVTLNVGSTCIWFVDNAVNPTDGDGTGTSSDPFSSLVDETAPDALPDDAEDASLAGDIIYVFDGNSNDVTTPDPYLGGFTAQANETILGEGVDLVVDLGSGPETLFDSPGNPQPVVQNFTGSGFVITDVTGVELAGFSVDAGSAGVDINAATTGVSAIVRNNTIDGDFQGVRIAQDAAGTSVVAVMDNTAILAPLVATGNGILAIASAGVLELAIDNNAGIEAALNGIDLIAGAGTIVLTSLCGNTISGNTGESGIVTESIIFDANPADSDFVGDQVTCSLPTVVGSAANPVGRFGIVLDTVIGDLNLGQVDIHSGTAGGLSDFGLRVVGNGSFDAAAGTGFQFTTSGGTVRAVHGPALSLETVDLFNMALTTLTVDSSDLEGVFLNGVTGTLTTNGGNSTIQNTLGDAFAILNTPVTGLNVTYDGSITNSADSTLLVQNHLAGTVTFNGAAISATGGDGFQFDNADGTYQITAPSTLNGGDAGVDIVNDSSGSFSFSDTDITSPAGIGVNIDSSGPALISFAGGSSLTQGNNASAVRTANRSGGPFNYNGMINATNGDGLQFNNDDGTDNNFGGLVTLNGGDAGIDIINGSSAVFTFGNTSITSPTGPGVRVADSGPAIVSFGNGSSLTYATAGQPAVLLQNRVGGAFTFSGQINATNGTGLRFDNNDGSTTTFNSTVTLNGGDAGIDIINGSSGSYTFSNTTITDPLGFGFNVDNSSGGITWSAGGVTQNNAASAVRINSHGGGIVNLFAPITGNTATANAVDLTGTNSGTYNFRGGLDLDTTTGIAFNVTGGGTVNVCDDSACNATGSALSNTVGVTGSAFAGINFVNTTIGASGVTFDTVDANGAADGINLTNAGAGDFAALGGTIQNVTDRGVDVSGGSGDVRVDASIDTTTSGRSVEVTTHTGGTVDFNGLINDDGLGIRLASNIGAILRFDGGMDIDTVGANIGFDATNNSALHVTGTNDVNTSAGTGIAVNIVNTSFGLDDVTFRNVSADGAASGIVLDTTGTTGAFEVTGVGTTDESGGVIDNTTADAVILSDVDDVTLRNMRLGESTTLQGDSPDSNIAIAGDAIDITDSSDLTFTNLRIADTSGDGIKGTGVTDLVLSDSEIFNVGLDAGSDETAFDFGDNTGGADANLLGTVAITNTVFDGMQEFGVYVYNDTGALTLNITGGRFSNQRTNDAESGILVETDGTATMDVTVTGLTCDVLEGAACVFAQALNGTLDLVATNNTVMNGGSVSNFNNTDGFNLVSGDGTLNFDISDNDIQRNRGHGVRLAATFGGTLNGQVTGNDIDGDGPFPPSASAQPILLVVDGGGAGDPRATVLIDNNDIDDVVDPILELIDVEARDGVTFLDVTVTNNRLNQDAGATLGDGDHGIEIRSRDNASVRAIVSSNTVTSPDASINLDVEDSSAMEATVVGNILFASGSNELEAATEDPGTSLCLDLRSHTSGVFDLLEISGVFTLENFATVAGDNAGATVNVGGGITADGGNCTEPASPTFPVP